MEAQGRFSGRLLRKDDEAILIEECARLGPLLGGEQTAGGVEKERSQLSQIVRAIVSGDIRRYLEARLADSKVRATPPTHLYCHLASFMVFKVLH